MLKISSEQILENRNKIFIVIDKYISSPRKEALKAFYEKYDERLTMMPASHKREFHSAFPGGYYYHVLNVIQAALKVEKVWKDMGVDTSTYTQEELIFSALNHDLGKMGDEVNESYLPQEDQWRRDKLKEDYMFNKSLQFASVPDRGLFLLQSHGIPYTFNEMLAIQTHDGLYDDANKKYLINYSSEQKPRTSLPYILHQADLLAARIEWEQDWLEELTSGKETPKKVEVENKVQNKNKKDKALSSIKSENMLNILNTL